MMEAHAPGFDFQALYLIMDLSLQLHHASVFSIDIFLDLCHLFAKFSHLRVTFCLILRRHQCLKECF